MLTPPTRGIELTTTSVVHVNDFIDSCIAMEQGLNSQQNKFCCTLLHTTDYLFHMMSLTDKTSQKEATSTTKLLQGVACWAT
jgi:hypothetical protein